MSRIKALHVEPTPDPTGPQRTVAGGVDAGHVSLC